MKNRVSTIFKRDFWARLAGTGGPPWKAGASVGLGVFIGFLPLVPFQSLIALALAFLFRLNRVSVLAGTLVMQPLTAPAIVAFELAAGHWMLGIHAAAQPGLTGWMDAMVLGAPIVSAAAGVVSGTASWLVFRRTARRKGSSNVFNSEEGAA